jgi:hypothetical protein
MIRMAEKHMAAGKYALAVEQLSLAQQLEPQNQYIRAIMERARILESSSTSNDDSNRYLSVTVGNKFDGGIRGQQQDDPASAEETRLRIRELTETAHILLNRGLSESAFETLMKAYLLDPLNPDVISAEKRVLPAWELVRRQKHGAASRDATLPGITPVGQTGGERGAQLPGAPSEPREDRGLFGLFRRRR